MNIHLIGIHVNNENRIIGFRLMDIDSYKTMDSDYDSVYNQVVGHSFNIAGIHKSSFEDGSLLAYPTFINNTLQRNNIPIFLDYINNQYIICNWKGKIEKLNKEDFIHIVKKFGILDDNYTYYM